MKDRAFIYKFATQVGVFRIQPHDEKWGLFIDYSEGDFVQGIGESVTKAPGTWLGLS